MAAVIQKIIGKKNINTTKETLKNNTIADVIITIFQLLIEGLYLVKKMLLFLEPFLHWCIYCVLD